MPRSKRYNKNLSKVQSYIDGTYGGKIQVGYTPDSVERKLGDRWTDSDGDEWEQKEGYKEKISKLAKVGIFSKVCKDCEKPCIKSFDKDTYNRMDRCYNCQVYFEEELKWNRKNRIGENGNKWQFWVKLQILQRWESIDKEMEQLIEDNYQQDKKNPYDMSVANAMANENVSMTIKNNK